MARGLMRWDPFRDLMASFPGDLIGRLGDGGLIEAEWNPRCDISEGDKEIIVRAELPGVAQEDMEVTVEQGVLTIRGEKKVEASEEKEGKSHRERFFGSFTRSFTLPEGVSADDVTAELKDGVLEVRLPRREVKAPEVKKIAIGKK